MGDDDLMTPEEIAKIEANNRYNFIREERRGAIVDRAVEFVEHAGAETMTNCQYYQRLMDAVERWKEAQGC